MYNFPRKMSSTTSQKSSPQSNGLVKRNYTIESDEKRIKQVLINLQSNALKFSHEGGSIRIHCEYIRGMEGDTDRT